MTDQPEILRQAFEGFHWVYCPATVDASERKERRHCTSIGVVNLGLWCSLAGPFVRLVSFRLPQTGHPGRIISIWTLECVMSTQPSESSEGLFYPPLGRVDVETG